MSVLYNVVLSAFVEIFIASLYTGRIQKLPSKRVTVSKTLSDDSDEDSN